VYVLVQEGFHGSLHFSDIRNAAVYDHTEHWVDIYTFHKNVFLLAISQRSRAVESHYPHLFRLVFVGLLGRKVQVFSNTNITDLS